MRITQLTQDQVEFDFSMIPSLYQTVTLVLPGKQVVVELDIGNIHDRPIDNQVRLNSMDLVLDFKAYQQRAEKQESTIAGYQSVLVALAEFLPEWPPSIAEVNQFFDRYRTKKYSQVTRAEYWVRLNAWFNWAKECGYIMFNPMKHVTQPGMPTIEARVISPPDFVKVINHLREIVADSRPRQHTLPYERAIRDLAMLRFTYSTGCRISEVAGLRLRELHLEDRRAEIELENAKTKEYRSVYFGCQAQASLDSWLDIRPPIGDHVFLGTRGNGWFKKGFTTSGMYQAWRARQAAAGIGWYEFHEIRHSHVTYSLNNGVPIHHVSHQAGHRSPTTTLRVYAHSEDPERKQAYEGRNPDDDLE